MIHAGAACPDKIELMLPDVAPFLLVCAAWIGASFVCAAWPVVHGVLLELLDVACISWLAATICLGSRAVVFFATLLSLLCICCKRSMHKGC